MKASRGNGRSVRASGLFAAMVGLALSASGCIIDGSSSPPVDSDGDGLRDSIDLCPLDREDFNGVDDTDGCPDSCLPDVTVRWQIRSNLTAGNPLLTCAQAGNADTVTAWVDGPSFALNAFDVACPANQSGGSFVVELPRTGNYNVSLELSSGAGTTLLSETPILVQPVDCSGLSQTPVAELFVNF